MEGTVNSEQRTKTWSSRLKNKEKRIKIKASAKDVAGNR